MSGQCGLDMAWGFLGHDTFNLKLYIVFQIEMDVHDSLVSRKGEAQKQLARDVLQLSDCSLYQDVTLICSDGSLKLNSFLLAAVFPLFRDILGEVSHYDEQMVISLPDVVSLEIKILLDDLLKEEIKLILGDTLKFLVLNHPNKKSDTISDIERELKSEENDKVDRTNIELHSQEVEDAEVDFAELDPLGDDSNEEKDIVEDAEAVQDGLPGRDPKLSNVETDEKDPTMISGKLVNLDDLDERINQLFSKNADDINYSCHHCSYVSYEMHNMKRHVTKHINGLKELLKCTVCNKESLH